MRRRARLSLPALLLLLSSAALVCLGASWQEAGAGDTDLRVDLPATGEVKIENRRGGVSVEVWGERYVSVSAAVEGQARAASPVRLERSEQLLSISVAQTTVAASTRAAGKQTRAGAKRRGSSASPPRAAALAPRTTAAAPRVDLILRVPAFARVQVFTGDGEVRVRDVPASLSAQTVAGDIHLDIPAPHDAELTAHSLNGQVVFKNETDAAAASQQLNGKKFQTRLGAGGRVVRLFSGRGRIAVEALSQVADAGVRQPQVETRSSQTVLPTPHGNPSSEAVETAREHRPPVLKRAGSEPTSTPTPQTSETSEEVGEDDVVRVETDLVTLNVSVVDRVSGRGLTGLTQSDFRLYEENVEQQIQHFEAAAAPFDLLLLIDLSGSTAKVTNIIRAAALRFIAATRPQDRIAIITFAGTTNLVSPLTTDREALRARVGAMEPPKGDTRLYDAVNYAMEYLSKESPESRRRAVVLMSDGLDSTLPNVTGVGSTLPYDELRSRVQEFDGVFYSIWTSTEYEAFSPEDIQPETFDLVHDRMLELSEAGGGVFYEVERLEDLAGAYERVVADLGTVYSLSYKPTNRTRDGRWRSIRVRLPRHRDAVARGKRGYYAK